jgi:hypothetical protein
MTARTIEGKAYAVPYDDFESTVTVGGEQYIVEFKVTESPSGGTVVHSVDIVKSPEPEFRARQASCDASKTRRFLVGNGGFLC